MSKRDIIAVIASVIAGIILGIGTSYYNIFQRITKLEAQMDNLVKFNGTLYSFSQRAETLENDFDDLVKIEGPFYSHSQSIARLETKIEYLESILDKRLEDKRKKEPKDYPGK
ncbi:MAG: hypothetical protein CMM60_04305 [Rhodospirillaceae bacterium]|jgi:MFS superfamily sulfate permease-like transporter|nr:hypothetical protein [Rhodospirillaceae bacterium]|tara:strand:- start:592 stop:930 length:339 start_codon:yes stop_codon:yes gene_type:complete